MRHGLIIMVLTALCQLFGGCDKSARQAPSEPANGDAAGVPHTHADGSVHTDEHGETAAAPDDHAHEEVSLGEIMMGDLQVKLAQGHGKVESGKESHLVVKLSYDDRGATIVRAWLGTKDRTLSRVAKGDYAASHNDYDIHATAPDPLPENALWWIEIEKPDETTLVGSAEPIR